MRAPTSGRKATRVSMSVLSAALACAACDDGRAPLPASPPPSASAAESLVAVPKGAVTTRETADFRKRPPQVEEMWATPSGDGRTDLHVVFKKDERLGDALTLAPDGEKLAFKREDNRSKTNGDAFATTLDVSFSQVADSGKRLAELLRKRGLTSAPIFDGRAIVGKRPLPIEIGGDFIPLPVGGIPGLVDEARSLMITATSVVEDPTRTGTPCGGNTSGVWSFKHLMEEMANQPVTGTDPADLAELWLNKWLTVQSQNGFNAPARLAMNGVLAAWPRVGGKLDLARAPFKLLAIVNRIDLAGNPSYGPSPGAEGRFVFELVDQVTCAQRSFLAIFEYGVPRSSCTDLRDWAQQWLDLANHPLGSPAYNAALELITEQFAGRNANPAKPNGSALNQLRTNEIALSFPWELREFKLLPLFPEVPLLRTDTVKLTPDASFNGTASLQGWIDGAGVPPAAALPPAIPVPPDFWSAPGVLDNNKRHAFSLSTCNGCHKRETNTIFTHVSPAPLGSPAPLSGFLTGITVIDPVDPTVSRSFNDLAQRASKLQAFASSSCRPFLFPALIERVSIIRPIPPIDITPHGMPH